MTGSKGNSEFCFPETLSVPWGEALSDWLQGRQWILFPETLNVPRGEAEFSYTSQLKI